MIASRKGAVLGIVLVVLLMLTLLATAAMKMPGTVSRSIPLHEKRMQDIYRGESAIIAFTEQFPAGFFNGDGWNLNLPDVEFDHSLLWQKISVGISSNSKISAVAGVRYRRLGLGEIEKFAVDFPDDLKTRISSSNNLKKLSGSKRISGFARDRNVLVENGDLVVDLEGKGISMNLGCDGNVVIKGSVQLDTLRLYAAGDVTLSGTVSINHLEAYSGGLVEVSRSFSFSGLLLARKAVSFRELATMKFPAVAVSSDDAVSLSSRMEKTVCADSVFGKLHVASSRKDDFSEINRHLFLDSACLLPASMEGKLLAFRWSME